MSATDTTARPRGRQFFANPGPTNIPDSVLLAVAHHTVDFNDAAFMEVYEACFEGLKRVLKTRAGSSSCTPAPATPPGKRAWSTCSRRATPC